MIDSEQLFLAFQRYIDYEAYFLKMWFDECTKEGHAGSETQKHYQFGYNQLVSMRQHLTNPEWVVQFTKQEFNTPPAMERIFIK